MGSILSELKAAMDCLKESLRSQMKTMEADLRKDPIPHQALMTELWRVEPEWSKVEKYHRDFLILTDGEQAKDEYLAHIELNTHYIGVTDQVQDAIDGHQLEKEARSQDQSKVSEVHAQGDRWKDAYLHIDTALDELMTQLGGEPIDDVEQLGVLGAKLDAIRAQINSAETLANAMFTADPDQTVITETAQATRKTAAEVKVHKCKELVTAMLAATDARNTATAATT